MNNGIAHQTAVTSDIASANPACRIVSNEGAQPIGESRKSFASSGYLELKRRGVLHAGTSYTLVAWLIAQVAELVGDIFVLPDLILQVLVIALVIGMPIALFLAWAFELTPNGLKRDSEVTPSESAAGGRGRSLVCGLIAILVLTIVALAINPKAAVCSATNASNSDIALYFPPESTKLGEVRS